MEESRWSVAYGYALGQLDAQDVGDAGKRFSLARKFADYDRGRTTSVWVSWSGWWVEFGRQLVG